MEQCATNLVVDPELPEFLRAKLLRLHKRGKLDGDDGRLKFGRLKFDEGASKGFAVALGVVLISWANSEKVPAAVVLTFAIPAGLVAVGIASYFIGRAVGHFYGKHRCRKIRKAAQGRYVLLDVLGGEPRALLRRALEASRAVLTSEAHQQGKLDRQRNDVVLPVQLWGLARDLEEHRRLSGELPEEVSTEEGQRAREASRAALRRYLRSVEQRVVALEEYAKQVDWIDILNRKLEVEVQEHEQLARTHGEILDLLARTEAGGLAVEESEQLSAEASRLTQSLAEAVEAARNAAVIALPAQEEEQQA